MRWHLPGVPTHATMTEIAILAILLAIWTATMRVIRKVVPGALPILSNAGMRSFLRARLFGPSRTFRHAGIKPGWRVLEVGPGWGFLTHEALREVGPAGELVCVDISEQMLRRCRRHVEGAASVAHCLQADATVLPFAPRTFDAALLVSVVGEVQDKAGMLSEVGRCLKPGARAFVTEIVLHPDYVFPWTLRELARRAGLEVAAHHGHVLCHTSELVSGEAPPTADPADGPGGPQPRPAGMADHGALVQTPPRAGGN
jgi:SAM-dependent methyltransferase